MSSKQWLEVFVISVAMMFIGSYLGVNHYKRSCERISNNAMTDQWLECKI